MKNFKKLIILTFIALVLAPFTASSAESLMERVKGKVLIRVEGKGEAWYVNPADGKRYFLGRPRDALQIMRKLGLGITDKDLAKIPMGEDENMKGWKIFKNPAHAYELKYPQDWHIEASTNILDAKPNELFTVRLEPNDAVLSQKVSFSLWSGPTTARGVEGIGEQCSTETVHIAGHAVQKNTHCGINPATFSPDEYRKKQESKFIFAGFAPNKPRYIEYSFDFYLESSKVYPYEDVFDKILTSFKFTGEQEQNILPRIRGKILLQIEQKGEAWWVNPSDGRRYFMGKPQEAFNLTKRFGAGITDYDLFQIPLATEYFDETVFPVNGLLWTPFSKDEDEYAPGCRQKTVPPITGGCFGTHIIKDAETLRRLQNSFFESDTTAQGGGLMSRVA